MSSSSEGSDAPVRTNTRLWAWGQRALARTAELEAWSAQLQRDNGDSPSITYANHVLRDVRRAADGRRPWIWRRSMWVDSTVSNTNAANCLLLRAVPSAHLPGYLPEIVAYVQKHLQAEDPRRIAVEQVASTYSADKVELTSADREMLLTGVHEAHEVQEREYVRLRHFRFLVFVIAAALSVVVAGVAFVGFLFPDMLPVCFGPEGMPQGTRACPTGDSPQPWDYAVVQGVGVIAASIAAVAGLRKIGGTASPYEMPAALGVLKLPTGALTALFGLFLMSGGFIPGLSALDSPAQIMAWAIVLGYAQELFTRLVDQKGKQALDAVGMAEDLAAPARAAHRAHTEQAASDRPL